MDVFANILVNTMQKSYFIRFSVSILNIENYDFSDMYGYCLEIAALWKFANHASIK